MIWQDWVIMIVQWGFILALVPTIRERHAKPPLTTCVMTVVGLVAMAICFATLGMWASVLSLSVMAVLWSIIGYQRNAMNAAATERVVEFRRRNHKRLA